MIIQDSGQEQKAVDTDRNGERETESSIILYASSSSTIHPSNKYTSSTLCTSKKVSVPQKKKNGGNYYRLVLSTSILIDRLLHLIQLCNHILQFLAADLVRYSGNVITLLERPILTRALDLLSERHLNILLIKNQTEASKLENS